MIPHISKGFPLLKKKKTRPLAPPLDSDWLKDLKGQQQLTKWPVNQQRFCRCHMTSTQTCFVTYHPGKQINIIFF